MSEIVEAFQAATRAWIRWQMTPRWRRRLRRRRRAEALGCCLHADIAIAAYRDPTKPHRPLFEILEEATAG